jgi:hypothetical protein
VPAMQSRRGITSPARVVASCRRARLRSCAPGAHRHPPRARHPSIHGTAWNPDRKFIYVEQAFFQRWWAEADDQAVALVKTLVANGQLEFINGGWCVQRRGCAAAWAVLPPRRPRLAPYRPSCTPPTAPRTRRSMHDEANPGFADMIDNTAVRARREGRARRGAARRGVAWRGAHGVGRPCTLPPSLPPARRLHPPSCAHARALTLPALTRLHPPLSYSRPARRRAARPPPAAGAVWRDAQDHVADRPLWPQRVPG